MKKSFFVLFVFILAIFGLTACDPWYFNDISDTNVRLNKAKYSPGESIEITFSGNLKKKERIDGLNFYCLIKRYNENNEAQEIDASEIIISDENSLEYEKGTGSTHPAYNLKVMYTEENIIISFNKSFKISLETPGKYELEAVIQAASMKMRRIPRGENSFVVPFVIE